MGIWSRNVTSFLSRTGVSNPSAMAGRIDFIIGVAGQYEILAAVKAMLECNFVTTGKSN